MKKRYWFNKETQEFVELKKRPYKSVAPSILCDTIDEYCTGTGKHYTSRSERNRDLKEAGIEPVSSDFTIKQKEYEIDEQELIEDILKTENDLRWGVEKPHTEGDIYIGTDD